NSMFVADAPQFLHENGGRHYISALALNRLDENRRDFLGGQSSFEQFLFQKARAAQCEFIRLLLTTGASAIHIGIANMRNAGYERSEAAVLLRFGGSQRNRAHGAAMKSSKEGDDVLPLRMVTRQLERAFHGFGARIPIVNAMRAGHRSDLRKPL